MSKTARAAIVLAIAGAALAFYLGHRAHDQGSVKVGDDAPAFTLPRLGQGSLALDDFRQQVVVLNFWASWCPPCIEESPSLEQFAVRMKPRGVTVIGVSVDQDPAALAKFVADYHLTFPIARDPEQVLAARYGTSKFPETYIIDRYGRVAEKIIGAIDWQDPRIITFVEGLAPGGSPPSQ